MGEGGKRAEVNEHERSDGGVRVLGKREKEGMKKDYEVRVGIISGGG